MRRNDTWLLMLVAMMLPASAGKAQVVIDMPPPPAAKAAPAETAQAAPEEDEIGVGEVALARYRYARSGARDTYFRLPPYRGGYSYYGPYHAWDSWYIYPGRRYPYLWGGYGWTWTNVTIHCPGDGDAK